MAASFTTPGIGRECTEDGCVTPEVAHAFSLDCDALGCTCGALESAHRVG